LLEGIQLTLLIGPGIPVPAPRPLLDALREVQVVAAAGETQSGFELTFAMPREAHAIAQYVGLGGQTLPVVRVVIVVTVGGTPHVLIDGVITRSDVEPGDRTGALLRVKGKDLSALMALVDLSGIPYPALPRFARVALILAKYAAFGIIPKVVPALLESAPLPTERIPAQQGSDLDYVRSLADEVGHVFFLEPGPVPGMSLAYWGPDIKLGVPQPALTVDSGAHTNVESLAFSFDREAAELPVVYVQNRETRAAIPIPVPDVTPLNPPLGLLPPLPPRVRPLPQTVKLDPFEAALQGVAHAARTAECVTGPGSLNVLRYGRPLRARALDGVRGAGLPFDGLYYVRRVTHTLRRGEYRQDFNLTRNGLFPTVPTVAP